METETKTLEVGEERQGKDRAGGCLEQLAIDRSD